MMSNPKFTPGPWEMEQNGKRGAWVKGASGEWTALACGNTDASATNNAYLIAAAPDLYEALELVVGSTRFDRDDAATREVTRRIDAALARARGEA